MHDSPDVLILGGGVIGLTTAWFLAREGVSVTLLDREDLGRQASWAGAGILPPAEASHARTPAELLRARSISLHSTLAAELLTATGIDNGYRLCGGIEVGEADETLPTQEWAGESVDFQVLDRPGIDALEPGLAPVFDQAVHLPGLAQVRNPRHLQALVAACSHSGVDLRPHCPVHSFQRRDRRLESVETEGGALRAGQFLVATGAWTGDLLASLGFAPPIVPVRGQIALLRTAREGIRPVLMQGKRYLVPRDDGLVLAGSTEEHAGFDARPTAWGIGGLLAWAPTLLPELAGAAVERCWAGLRPGSPDGLPFLGRVPGFDNLFLAAGHFRAGIQLSPGTALLMTELLTGVRPSLPLEPFRPDRFPIGEGGEGSDRGAPDSIPAQPPLR
jgi:glycine oxidase